MTWTPPTAATSTPSSGLEVAPTSTPSTWDTAVMYVERAGLIWSFSRPLLVHLVAILLLCAGRRVCLSRRPMLVAAAYWFQLLHYNPQPAAGRRCLPLARVGVFSHLWQQRTTPPQRGCRAGSRRYACRRCAAGMDKLAVLLVLVGSRPRRRRQRRLS